jgi:N utilization substance protein A
MVAELLYQDGFKSAEELAEAELETILEVEGIGKEKAEAIYKSSREYVAEKRRKEEEEKAKAAAQAETVPAPAAESSSATENKAEETT